MKKYLILIFITICLLQLVMLVSCEKRYYLEREFISEYHDYNFDIFCLNELKLRGNKENQKLISLRKFDSINNEVSYKTYIVDSVKNIEYYPAKYYNSETPSAKDKSLIKEFVSIDISYLRVDSDLNVKISIDNYEDFNLVKVKDSINYFNKRKASNYAQLIKNWYVLKSRH